MKPASFDYLRADTSDEALAVLAEAGAETRVLAGGQSLMPMLNMRLARPSVILDINAIKTLSRIDQDREALVVGACVRQVELMRHPGLAAMAPLLARALPWVGHPQTRARGTICGSIAHADPSAELPLCLVALQGRVHLRSKRARRSVTAQAFFAGMMTTDRVEDEMIEAVSFPLAQPHTGFAFHEFGRRHGDFAIVACAAVASTDRVELSVGGVNDVPARRVWKDADGEGLDEALNAFAWELDARTDVHADARLRRDLVRSLGRRSIEEARACIV